MKHKSELESLAQIQLRLARTKNALAAATLIGLGLTCLYHQISKRGWWTDKESHEMIKRARWDLRHISINDDKRLLGIYGSKPHLLARLTGRGLWASLRAVTMQEFGNARSVELVKIAVRLKERDYRRSTEWADQQDWLDDAVRGFELFWEFFSRY